MVLFNLTTNNAEKFYAQALFNMAHSRLCKFNCISSPTGLVTIQTTSAGSHL